MDRNIQQKCDGLPRQGIKMRDQVCFRCAEGTVYMVRIRGYLLLIAHSGGNSDEHPTIEDFVGTLKRTPIPDEREDAHSTSTLSIFESIEVL